MDYNNKFKDLLDKYNEIKLKVDENINSNIFRTSNKNPYRNKFVESNGDIYGYITNKGVLKPVLNPSSNIKDAVALPKDANNKYYIQGTPLGKDVSIGNEGSYIYVNTLAKDIKNEYSGCYELADNLGVKQNLTPEQCKSYAMNEGYNYYGINNNACYLTNSITELKKSVPTFTTVPVWASNTQGTTAKFATMNSKGQLLVTDGNNNVIWSSKATDESCAANGGNIDMESIVATYGADCNGSSICNATNDVKNKINSIHNKTNYSIPITNPFMGANKKCSFDISYQCGNSNYSQNIIDAYGKTLIIDCTNDVKKCDFMIEIKDEGMLILKNNNNDKNNMDVIWQADLTPNIPIIANSEYMASKGKYGRNYLKTGESLTANEWIGSPNGMLKLMMQPDGNLVLYTFQQKNTCELNSESNMMMGNSSLNIAAFYNLLYSNAMASVSNPIKSLLFSLGFITADSKLKVIDKNNDEKIGLDNNYDVFNSYTIMGNDLSIIDADMTYDKCQTECTNNNQCGGYVWNKGANVCYLKEKNTPFQEKTWDTNTMLGVRRPRIVSGGNLELNNVDAIEFANYEKVPDNYTEDIYNDGTLGKIDMDNLTDMQNQMDALGSTIMTQLQNTKTNDKNDYVEMDKNIATFEKILKKYEKAQQILSNNKTNKTSKIEGFIGSSDTGYVKQLFDTTMLLIQGQLSYAFLILVVIIIIYATIMSISKN